MAIDCTGTVNSSVTPLAPGRVTFTAFSHARGEKPPACEIASLIVMPSTNGMVLPFRTSPKTETFLDRYSFTRTATWGLRRYPSARRSRMSVSICAGVMPRVITAPISGNEIEPSAVTVKSPLISSCL